jgi:exopolysaccharide biosynthesis polyprenyl glycosylphosphotransferase
VTRHQAVLFRQILLVFDVLVSTAAFSTALLVRGALTDLQLPTLDEAARVQPVVEADYYSLLWAMVPMWALALSWSNCNDFRASHRRAVVRYARAVGGGLALLVVTAFIYKADFVARSFVFLLGGIQLAMLIVGRVILLEIVAAIRRQDVDGHRVLVVGCGEQAIAFASSLGRSSPWNNRLVGHITVPGERCHDAAEPIVGELERITKLLDSEPVDEVVFAVPGYDASRFADALQACDERGIDVLLSMPSVIPPSGSKVEIASVTGFDLPMLGMTRVPTAQGRLLVKRIVDIAGALVGLLLASPVLIGTILAIKITSPGPVFFKQVRAGRHGRKFTMFKFRSMVVDAEKLRAKLEHLNEMNGPVFKIKKDPRITAVGRFIRATSIDELPQLFNVLLGDMSLVGPRPPLPSEVGQYEPWQRRRLSVKPGLTGLWQVSGRNQVDFEQWMALDLQYIDNWSLWLDMKILFRTVPAVLRGSGAS